MLDVFNIPGQKDNVSIFYARGTTDWQTWNKPRNCKFIWIMCIGAGAGGMGGGTINSGAGGGSGGICRVLYPANTLPDVLFVQPGVGSTGGTGTSTSGGNVATAANRSFVTITAGSTVQMNTVCASGAASAGTTNNFAAETIATTTQAGLMSLGNFTAVAGQAGDSTLVGITPLVTTITCGGAAGYDGGTGLSVNSVNLGIYTTPQITGGADFGGSGGSGIWSWKPMFGLGGAGGSNSQTSVPPGTGTGGNGGNGAYGCGGGGGGRGSIIGGNGGRGGDGLVIITTF